MNHIRAQAHLFLATDLSASKLPGDENEILEVQKFPFDVAYNRVVRQQIPSAQNALIFELVKNRLTKSI